MYDYEIQDVTNTVHRADARGATDILLPVNTVRALAELAERTQQLETKIDNGSYVTQIEHEGALEDIKRGITDIESERDEALETLTKERTETGRAVTLGTGLLKHVSRRYNLPTNLETAIDDAIAALEQL